MNEEELDHVQDLIDLDEDQLKAWRKLNRAYRDCLKANINFIQVDRELLAFNKHNIRDFGIYDLKEGLKVNLQDVIGECRIRGIVVTMPLVDFDRDYTIVFKEEVK